jgi:hypothetical protein
LELNARDGMTEADLAILEQLTELDTLQLTGVPATDATMKMLRNLPALHTLRLRELGKLTVVGFRSVAAMPALTSLSVRGPMNAESLAAIATNRKLENLTLNDAAFGEQEFGAIANIPAAAWARLAPMKKLNRLTVENTPKTPEMIAQIGKLTELTHLYLGDVTLPDAQLAALGGLKRLETLQTSPGSTIEGTFCSAWAPHPAMKTLTLRSTRSVSDKVLRLIASNFPKLTHLEIRANAGSVTPAGFAYLPALEKLDYLAFTGDAVDDAGLAHLSRCPQLQHLGVGSAQITDTGLQAMTKLGALRELDWSNPPVTDVALKSYGKLRGLTLFHLGPGTKPEVEGTLKASLRGVTITR